MPPVPRRCCPEVAAEPHLAGLGHLRGHYCRGRGSRRRREAAEGADQLDAAQARGAVDAEVVGDHQRANDQPTSSGRSMPVPLITASHVLRVLAVVGAVLLPQGFAGVAGPRRTKAAT